METVVLLVLCPLVCLLSLCVWKLIAWQQGINEYVFERLRNLEAEKNALPKYGDLRELSDSWPR